MPPRERNHLDEAESRQREEHFQRWKEEKTRDGKVVAPQVVPVLAQKMHNRPCSGRPAIPERARVWSMRKPHKPQPLPEGMHSSAEAPAALDNFQGYCYRNTILLMLLNEPAFVNWLMRHRVGMCLKVRECLLCAFRNLIQEYHQPFAKSPAVHYALEVFWDLCERSFWGIRAKRKVVLGSTESWKGNTHLGFLFHLLDELLRQTQHLPHEVQLYHRLFYTEAIKVRACLDCGAFDERGTEGWVQRRIDIGRADITSTSTGDILQRTTTKPIYEMPCLHCSGRLLEQLKIISPAELILLILPPTPLNESEAKTHPFIPMTPELTLDVVGRSDGPRYYLQAAAISPPRRHVFACVRARSNKLYKIDNGATSPFKSWQHYERAQKLGILENRVYPKVLLYTRRGPSDGSLSIAAPLKPVNGEQSSPDKASMRRKLAPGPKGRQSTPDTLDFGTVKDANRVTANPSNDTPTTGSDENASRSWGRQVPHHSPHPSQKEATNGKRLSRNGAGIQKNQQAVTQNSPGLAAGFANISFNDSDTSVNHANTISAAFPALTLDEASQLLAANNGSLQQAVDALKTYPSQQSMLLETRSLKSIRPMS